MDYSGGRSLEDKALLRSVSVSVLAAIVVPVGAMAQVEPPVKQLEPPAVTTVLPANTPGVVLINTSPAAWAEVNQFNPLPDSAMGLFTLLLQSMNFNLQQDVLPWLGDRAAIALLPNNSQAKALAGNGVLLVPVTDTPRFNTFLGKLKTTWGNPQIERDYKGVTILQWTPPTSVETPETPDQEAPNGSPAETPEPEPKPEPETTPAPQPKNLLNPANSKPLPSLASSNKPSGALENDLEEKLPPLKPLPPAPPPNELLARGIAIALLPNSVAVSNQAQSLEILIDSRSNDTSLAQNPLFQRTLRHPQFGRSIVSSYGDIKEALGYLSVFASTIPNSPLPLLLPSLEAGLTKYYNTIDSHLWVQPEGLQSQSNFYYTTPQPTWATEPVANPNQILNRLPTATFLSANSRNFKRQWESWAKSDTGNLGSQLFFGGIQSNFRSITGLDLEKDLIPWLDGEYALFMYPSTRSAFKQIAPNFNLGVGLMLQTSDRPAAENALKKLNQRIRSVSKGEVKIVPRRVNGLSFISWEGRDAGKPLSVFSYGWLDKNTLVMTSGVGALAELVPKPYLPLDRNFTFKTATAALPIPNEGYLYINMGSSLSFIYSLVLPSVPREYSPFVQEFQRALGTIRSVSTTNSATAESARIDALWVLERRR